MKDATSHVTYVFLNAWLLPLYDLSIKLYKTPPSSLSLVSSFLFILTKTGVILKVEQESSPKQFLSLQRATEPLKVRGPQYNKRNSGGKLRRRTSAARLETKGRRPSLIRQ